MCEDEFSDNECQQVTNTLPLAFCSPLRAVTHSKQGACWPMLLVYQLSGCLLKWQEPKAELNSIENSAVSGTSSTGQASSWSSFQMDWDPARKRNTISMQGHDLVLFSSPRLSNSPSVLSLTSSYWQCFTALSHRQTTFSPAYFWCYSH